MGSALSCNLSLEQPGIEGRSPVLGEIVYRDRLSCTSHDLTAKQISQQSLQVVYDGKLQGLFSGETIEIQKASVKKILYFSGFVAFYAGTASKSRGTRQTHCSESGTTNALKEARPQGVRIDLTRNSGVKLGWVEASSSAQRPLSEAFYQERHALARRVVITTKALKYLTKKARASYSSGLAPPIDQRPQTCPTGPPGRHFCQGN